MELTRSLIGQRESGTISEYIRGLIIADAIKQHLSLSGISIPGWLTNTLVELHLVHAQVQIDQRPSGTSPLEEKRLRGKPNESSAHDDGKQDGKKTRHAKSGSG